MPKAEIDWEILDTMLRFGPTRQYVADHFGYHPKTIDRLIRDKYDQTFDEYKNRRMDHTRLKLQQKAMQMAFGGDRVMMIFCLKNICKWQDKFDVEQTNTDKKIYVNVFDNENPIHPDKKTS